MTTPDDPEARRDAMIADPTPKAFADAVAGCRDELDGEPIREAFEHLLVRGAADAALCAELTKRFRARRWFQSLSRAADACHVHGRDTPLLRTYKAQALLELGQLDMAIAVLDDLLDAVPPGDVAAEEARGLLGRAYKQIFVASSPGSIEREAAILQAIKAYERAFREATRDPSWPGINVVALVHRAIRDGIDPGRSIDAKALARAILLRAEQELSRDAAAIADREEAWRRAKPWLVATALEASLALNAPGTLTWARRYLACADADAFEFGSTLRQLVEIWQLRERLRGGPAPEAYLVDLLEERVLSSRGGVLRQLIRDAERLPASSDARVVQANYGDESFRHAEWWDMGRECRMSVALIQTAWGKPVATGFLLNCNGHKRVMTNAHAVAERAPDRGVSLKDARVVFTQSPDRRARVPRSIKWFSPKGELDACVLELDDSDVADVVGLEPGDDERLSCASPPSRVYVIGHPQGGPLSYSVFGTELQTRMPPSLRYHSPTEAGSSGSALFDDSWTVVGIHHSTLPAHRVNEGTLISAIIAAGGFR